MKNKSNTRAALSGRGIPVAIGFCMGVILLFTGGCEKAEQHKTVSQPASAHVLNSQEQLLVGNWNLRKKETYEVGGMDSLGNCLCNLLNTTVGDSTCAISFFGTIMGAGSIGGCDANAAFSWTVPQSNTLQTNKGLYHIEYLCKDSMALSNTYVKDILELKDVYYYVKK